jgi:hypothetical protein
LDRRDAVAALGNDLRAERTWYDDVSLDFSLVPASGGGGLGGGGRVVGASNNRVTLPTGRACWVRAMGRFAVCTIYIHMLRGLIYPPCLIPIFNHATFGARYA